MTTGIIEGTPGPDVIDSDYNLDPEDEHPTSGDDIINGDTGNDRLIGGAGADDLIGGPGTDTADYSTAAGNVFVNLTNGTGFFGDAAGDTLSSIENLIGSAFGDTLTGDSGANDLTGLSGNDVLTGRAGADHLDGSAGFDTADYIDSVDGVLVSLSAGTGFGVGAGGSAEGDILTSIEDLAGSFHDDLLIGDGLGNFLSGRAGDDFLQGDDGADALFGGDGRDTASYSASPAGVQVSLIADTASGGDATSDQLDQIENLRGSDHADTLTGDASTNLLRGLNGNDTLDGFTGADTMLGGDGDDTYFVDSAGDVVDETGSSGIDSVVSTVSFSLADGAHAKGEIENLALMGNADINSTGNALANLITGNDGVNILDGAGGADVLRGLSGNDTYVVDETDVVDETAAGSGGSDTVLASFSFLLGEALENLTLTSVAAINGTGNALANRIIGNAGANVIDGGAGPDTMRGPGGTDVYFVDSVGDAVDEAAAGSDGLDAVIASASFTLGDGVEDLTLTGTAAIDGTGNGLANRIAGNAAANRLTGGAGGDSFVFAAALNKKSNVDTIADFSVADDTILLDNAIFAKLKKDGALKKKFFEVGKKADDGNDVIVYNKKTGDLFYDKNGDDKGGAVKFAVLEGSPNDISKADFFVV